MTESSRGMISSLGALRLGLLAFTLVDILLPAVDALLRQGSLWTDGGRDSAAVIIASAMAPILLVVLLFDYIMSRIRAADGDAGEFDRFRMIGRVELAAMAALLLYWVPVVMSLGR